MWNMVFSPVATVRDNETGVARAGDGRNRTNA